MKNPVKALSFVDAAASDDAHRTYYHFSRDAKDELVEEVHSSLHGTLRSRNHPGFLAPHPKPQGAVREQMIVRLAELRPLAQQALGLK